MAAIDTRCPCFALNQATASADSSFHWKPKIIGINEDTFPPIIDFKLSMAIGTGCFTRFGFNPVVGTEGAFYEIL